MSKRKQSRDGQIVELIDQGMSRKEVSKKFNLSVTRVSYLYRKINIQEERAQIRNNLLADIKTSNDLDKKYPLEEMCYLFGIADEKSNTIKRYFLYQDDVKINLNDIIYFLTPNVIQTDMGNYLCIPMIAARLGSTVLFDIFISEIFSLNLCPAFNDKWKSCKKEIKEYMENSNPHRIKHGIRI